MCERDAGDDDDSGGGGVRGGAMPDGSLEGNGHCSAYCLQASHLLLAWRTCTSKADAAVSAQIYQLLVSILPSLPPALAIPLIEAARASLDAPTNLHGAGGGALDAAGPSSGSAHDGEGASSGGDHFFEVSEFCRAIAEQMPADRGGGADGRGGPRPPRLDASAVPSSTGESQGASAVREAVLSLQWAVLSHRRARTLKSYECIQRYVSVEIRRPDVTTGALRRQFLEHCREEIRKYGGDAFSTKNGGDGMTDGGPCEPADQVDETHALHMCRLAKFLLEGYGRVEMERVVSYVPAEAHNHLPTLFYFDLINYMKRRARMLTMALVPARKSVSTAVPEFNHLESLTTRLQILRFVYGLLPAPKADDPFYDEDEAYSSPKLSTDQLDDLWNLCTAPGDREVLLTFLANASRPDAGDSDGSGLRMENAMHDVLTLAPAFSDNE